MKFIRVTDVDGITMINLGILATIKARDKELVFEETGEDGCVWSISCTGLATQTMENLTEWLGDDESAVCCINLLDD